MQKLVEFIILNYTWIIAGSIIILLAVIGYYADKTNFGQGKNKDQEPNENDINLEQVELVEQTNDEQVVESPAELTNPVVEEAVVEEVVIEPIVTEGHPDYQKNNSSVDLDEKFEKFDKEFNEIVPEKEVIDDELLDEIDSLSLDKTQKLNLTDIPDLDDVELPKIKNITKEENIWKF